MKSKKYLADEVYPTGDDGIAEETKSAYYDFLSRDVHCGDGDHYNVIYCPA